MIDLYESFDYVSDDYNKFKRDYEKFLEYVEDQDKTQSMEHALENIEDWVKDCDRHEGLPAGYWRYDEFLTAIFTFDPTLRNGDGGPYSEAVTKKLRKWWKEATKS